MDSDEEGDEGGPSHMQQSEPLRKSVKKEAPRLPAVQQARTAPPALAAPAQQVGVRMRADVFPSQSLLPVSVSALDLSAKAEPAA